MSEDHDWVDYVGFRRCRHCICFALSARDAEAPCPSPGANKLYGGPDHRDDSHLSSALRLAKRLEDDPCPLETSS